MAQAVGRAGAPGMPDFFLRRREPARSGACPPGDHRTQRQINPRVLEQPLKKLLPVVQQLRHIFLPRTFHDRQASPRKIHCTSDVTSRRPSNLFTSSSDNCSSCKKVQATSSAISRPPRAAARNLTTPLTLGAAKRQRTGTST